jgi:hypothetical protein
MPVASANPAQARPSHATMPLQLLDFLSLRTFSSVWYWIAVAVVWASVSQRPMGVPYDLVWRARRGGDAEAALGAVARVLARRLAGGMDTGGAVVVAVVSSVLSMLALLAFFYGLEFAQGLLLILLPLALVAVLNVRTARRIDGGEDPVRHLRRLRVGTQAVGIVALFLTAFWGMYVNLFASVL